MKTILKVFVFSYISIYLTQIIIGAYDFGDNANIPTLLVLIALTIINVFSTPVLRILSLPARGPGFIFLRFILSLVVFYILTLFIPSFEITDTTVPELIIFGVVLPSKGLSSIEALIFSTLLFVVILNFFSWLSSGKK